MPRSTTAFRGKTYTIRRVSTQRMGKRATFELAEHRPSVFVLALDARDRLVLNHEYRSRQKRYVWRLPAGGVDDGESPRTAATRELLEETGYRATHMAVFFSRPGTASQSLHWPVSGYLATGLRAAERSLQDDEDIDVHLVLLRKALRMALDGTINNELHAFAILKLAHERKLLKLR